MGIDKKKDYDSTKARRIANMRLSIREHKIKMGFVHKDGPRKGKPLSDEKIMRMWRDGEVEIKILEI